MRRRRDGSRGAPQQPVLDEAHAAFILGGVSMYVASRDASNVPTLARALGCRVSADRQRVTLLVARSQAAAILENVRETGAIAAVFTEPSTHRAIQLKGSDAEVTPAAGGDSRITAAFARAFAAQLAPLGFDATFVQAMFACDPDDLAAISFTPSAAFSQTPGARAGTALRG